MDATANRPAGQYLRQLFSLKPETDYAATLNQIKAGVDFKGGNLWALIFAILIASVGLNVNSTAVIIGFVFGSIVGLGTLIMACGTGPLISFHSRHFVRPILQYLLKSK